MNKTNLVLFFATMLVIFVLGGYYQKVEAERQFTVLGLEIGDTYQGGKVGYIDDSGQHGLVVTARDQSTHATWEEAMAICDNLVENGYSDWYLPSHEEVHLAFINYEEIGNFEAEGYWTSHNCSWTEILTQKMGIGEQNCTAISTRGGARCVRGV